MMKKFNGYDIEDGIITTPGIFEGKPRYVPYFWDSVLLGKSDKQVSWPGGVLIDYFKIDHFDIAIFPELKDIEAVALWEDDFGIVHCRTKEGDDK